MENKPADLPDYRDGGLGLPVFRGPYLQKDVSLAAFLYYADIQALTILCDQSLNGIASSPFRYVPVISNILLVYADMLVSSLDERDSLVGSFPESEAGFWVLTVAMHKTPLGEFPHHLAWFLPTLLVDESNSIATGREVYGFNKQAATFGKPKDIQSPSFTADVLGFKRFGAAAIAQQERLFELTSSIKEPAENGPQNWLSVQAHFVGEIAKNIRSDLGSSVVKFISKALMANIPLVFLKQVRSASMTAKASFQSIVEAPLHITNYSSGAMYTQSYRLTINRLESHPLADKLGLCSKQSTSFGAWLKLDFILELGIEH